MKFSRKFQNLQYKQLKCRVRPQWFHMYYTIEAFEISTLDMVKINGSFVH